MTERHVIAVHLGKPFSGLLPLTALVRRELVRTLRRLGPYLLTMLAVLLLTLVFIMAWPRAGTNLLSMGQQARGLVFIFFIGLQLAAAVMVTGAAATALVSEREGDTHDLLILTLLRPFEITAGKLINLVGLFLFVSAACLPVLAATFFLVGLQRSEVAVLAVITLSGVLTCAAAGLFVSAYARNIMRAVTLSYVLVVLLQGGWQMLVWVFVGVLVELLQWFDLSDLPLWLRPENFVATSAIGLTTMFSDVGATGSQLVLGVGYQLLVSAILFCLVWLRLRRPYSPAAAPAVRRPKGLMRHFSRPAAPIRDWENPMQGRELRWGAVARKGVRIRSWVILTIVTGLMCMAAASAASDQFYDLEMPIYTLILVQMATVCVIMPSVGASALTRESERHNLDMLRMTLLTPREIIVGNWRAAMSVYWPVLASFAVGAVIALPFAAEVRDGYAMLITLLPTLIVTAMLSASLSMVATVAVKKTSVAVILSFFLCGMFYVGVIFVGLVVLSFIQFHVRPGRGYEEDIMQPFLFLSPFGAYFNNLNSLGGYWGADHDPVGLYWALNVLFHGALSMLFLFLACQLYARVRSRDA